MTVGRYGRTVDAAGNALSVRTPRRRSTAVRRTGRRAEPVGKIAAAGELTPGLGVLSAFVKAGLVKSNGEARRQIAGGGLRVNDEAVKDEKAVLSAADARDGVIKLSLGRKRHVLLKPV